MSNSSGPDVNEKVLHFIMALKIKVFAAFEK